jgi:2-dehydro-3-deoxy-D-arabinonate dehydratase
VSADAASPHALFRVALPDGAVRLARGDVTGGPRSLFAADVTISTLLGGGAQSFAEAVTEPGSADVPAGARILAPVDDQEVWAAGVTYERSRDARMEESAEASVYDRVYDADRPELFFKSPGWRVRAHGDEIGVRADSSWDVPEPELALVVTPALEIAGFTIGNDVSSRTIEGENPLYLPQAKVYDGSCALGPAIVPATHVGPPFTLRLVVVRDGTLIVDEVTTSARIRRPLSELVDYLGRALQLPSGAILLTGTGIVPDPAFTLRAGDVVRIEAGALGTLENRVALVGRPRTGTEATAQTARR